MESEKYWHRKLLVNAWSPGSCLIITFPLPSLLQGIWWFPIPCSQAPVTSPMDTGFTHEVAQAAPWDVAPS